MILIVNPAAAGGKVGTQWPRLHRLVESLGIRARQAFTRAPGHATELAAEAVAQGTDTVVAVGGDGTVCEVAEGLYRSGGGVLGILPVGTGNDAARALGIPGKVTAAVAALRRPRVRPVDLIQVGSRVVVNAVGLGMLGTINAKAAAFKKVRGLGAYLLAALHTLARYRSPSVEIETEGFRFAGPMTILAIHNGPTTGGGFRLAPGAQPDDGVLDACLVENLSVPQRFPRLVAALRGTLGRWRKSHPFSFRQMRLRTPVALDAHLDGNPWVVPAGELKVQVLPQALAVLTPRQDP